MLARSVLCRIFITFAVSLMVINSAQAGIVPGFLKKLNPFNSKINPEDIEKHLVKKIKKLRKKSRKDPRAMAALAEYYNSGIGLNRDRKKALELYRKASHAGDAVAIYHMGEYYLTGLDVDNDGILEIAKDPVKGNALKRQAIGGIAKIAGKKDGEALYIMGLSHYRGLNGLQKNRKKARKYFDKGADRDYAKAMYWFGEILLTEGSKKHQKACDYFYKSALMNYSRGIYSFAYCLEAGRGRPKDTKLAREWYEYGTSNHSIGSMIRMGDIYVAQDSDENKNKAAEYYDMAIAENPASGYGAYARAAYESKKAYFYQQALAHNLGNEKYLKEVQTLREKDSSGREKIIGLEPKTYSRNDILALAKKAAAGHAGAKEYVKDFMLMGYIKSLEPVTLLTLENGFNSGYGTALFFSPDNKTLTITHSFGTSIFRQSVNSIWDVATKELIGIRALKPGYSFTAASDDGKKFIMEVRDTKYWDHPFSGDATLTLNDSETGNILFELRKLEWDDVYNFGTYFTGGDKYVNIYYDTYLPDEKKSQKRGAIYDTATGKLASDDRGIIYRKVSPNGLHVLTKSTPNDGDDYPDNALKHQRLPSWLGGKELKGMISTQYDEGIFSPDGRYWVTPEYLYDLKEDKDLGEHDSAHNTSVPFKNIPGTPLLIRVYNNAINIYLMDGPTITKVKSTPMDVIWTDFELTHVFSPDYSRVTINGVREGSAKKETYVQSFNLPTDEEIAKSLKDQQTAAKAKKELADIMEMFEVGFDDQAMEQMKALIARDPTSIKPSFEMLQKRAEISATAVGLAMKTAIEAALAQTEVIILGVKLAGKRGEAGTGEAIVDLISLYDANSQRAGIRPGDKIISLDGRPYFRSNTPEMQDYIDGLPGNQDMTLVIERDGRQMTLTYQTQIVADSVGLQNAMRQLFWYGLIANAAGHPDIAEMAAKRIEEIFDKKLFTQAEKIWGDKTRQTIALLKAVARAKKGDLKAAYNLLLTEKSLKAEDQWGVNHFDWNPDLLADLFKEPKKLAYILGKKIEELPKLDGKKVKAADYWTLDGRLVKPGEAAIVKEEGGEVID